MHPDLAFARTRLQGSGARMRLYMARTYGVYTAVYGTAPKQHVQEQSLHPG